MTHRTCTQLPVSLAVKCSQAQLVRRLTPRIHIHQLLADQRLARSRQYRRRRLAPEPVFRIEYPQMGTGRGPFRATLFTLIMPRSCVGPGGASTSKIRHAGPLAGSLARQRQGFALVTLLRI